MDIDDLFPSKGINAASLEGKEVPLTISGVKLVTFPKDGGGDEDKPTLTFQETDKELVLNRINAATIAEQHGKNTDKWTGAKIILFPTKTQYKGQTVDCVRIRVQLETAGNDDLPF